MIERDREREIEGDTERVIEGDRETQRDLERDRGDRDRQVETESGRE